MQGKAATVGLLLIALCALVVTGAARGAEAERQIMPVSEVKPGMTGYGLTSLGGGRPERFQVEVLGIVRGWAPKGDIILVRMSGPVIDETGTISGMSGSPIYIGDKLLGAVAYGWLYSKIPLAGVTPAAEMMQVERIEAEAPMDRRLAARTRAREALRDRSRELVERLRNEDRRGESGARLRTAVMQMAVPSALTTSRAGLSLARFPAAVRNRLPGGMGQEMQSLPIPMAISGLGGDGAHLLSLFEGTTFIPVQGAAVGANVQPDEEVKLEPGVPVGAAFVTGDMDVSGMGTLTWIKGDTAVAFGHSLFGSGQTDIPLAVGHVQTVVPSVYQSFMLMTAGKVVGRITQDRESAILAKIGQQAPVFPCKVRVRGTVDDEYNYRVAGYWETAALFTLLAVGDSSARWEGWGNRYTLKAKARISLAGQEDPVVLENVYTSYSVVPPSMDLVVFPMDMLLLNPYREVEIEGVDYELEVTPGFEAALIEAVWPDRVKAEPGSDVIVYVRLLKFRGERVMKKLTLHVPETARPGSHVEITVCDAMTDRMIKRSQDPGFFAPPDFESLIEMLEETESNKNLVMRASFFERGVRYAGDAMPTLPPSALSILQFGGPGGEVQPLVTEVKQSVATPWALEGSRSVSITIKRPEPHSP